MYYSSGNYEALSHPEKPRGVDAKSAYIIGSGLAGLSVAAFLVRDGKMKGSHIHILERDSMPGGACDGYSNPDGFVIRGGREMENHFECLWDLFSSIPSLEIPGVSVLDEFRRLNRRDPNYSMMRATEKRGQDAHTDGKFALSEKAAISLLKLFLSSDSNLYDKTIQDVLDPEFFSSNFWLYWRTMFAFEPWHSALEMKLYLQRFVHHIGGLPDFSALKFTKYNQYESLVIPLVRYLEANGVDFIFSADVKDIDFEINDDEKIAKSIRIAINDIEDNIDLTENDLLFITNGSCVENSTMGSQHSPAVFNTEENEKGAWCLWKKIASLSDEFGHPEKFCSDTNLTNWESATVTTLDDRIPRYLENVCKRNPFSGKVVTGGIVTCKDSSWLLSYTFNRQPHFRTQPKNELVGWIYGLYTDVPGDFIKKPMKECTGSEICAEWLYHLGVEEEKIMDLAENSANTVPVIMPYITSFFMPRTVGDRPDVVPAKSVNFAFIGQFAETKRDTIFTTEYSVRTAMEAVYTLLNIDRGVPEVWASAYDIRELMNATSCLLDGKKLLDLDLPLIYKSALKSAIDKSEGSVIHELLQRYNLI